MEKSLTQVIDEQDVWTFPECLGLAAEHNTKVHMVIATVYARGKTYVERDLRTGTHPAPDSPLTPPSSTPKAS